MAIRLLLRWESVRVIKKASLGEAFTFWQCREASGSREAKPPFRRTTHGEPQRANEHQRTHNTPAFQCQGQSSGYLRRSGRHGRARGRFRAWSSNVDGARAPLRYEPVTPADATYRVVVEYDGTDFCGFQFQPNLRTIAGELELALGRLFDRPVKVSVAGRTDAGVHASGQVISFVSHAEFPVEKLAIALNTSLPADITARDAARVDASFSARNSALARHYRYLVLNRRHPSAVWRRFAHHEYRALDVERMRAAAALLVGERDFATFCGVRPDRGGTVRTLHAIALETNGEFLRFRYEGAGFLHRMVRIMTGTLLDVGAGAVAPETVAAMLAARDRRVAGPTAPAQGLCLVNVVYRDFASSAVSRYSS